MATAWGYLGSGNTAVIIDTGTMNSQQAWPPVRFSTHVDHSRCPPCIKHACSQQTRLCSVILDYDPNQYDQPQCPHTPTNKSMLAAGSTGQGRQLLKGTLWGGWGQHVYTCADAPLTCC